MGCDGGTIPKRDELVRTKKKPEQVDKDAENVAKWKHCALSQEELKPPIVACELGRLYNKDAVIEHLLDKTDSLAKHIRSLKDVVELNLTENPAYNKYGANKGDEYIDHQMSKFICPVVGMEMNGKYKFYYIKGCGCVLSERALKEVKSEICHKCGKKYLEEDLVVLNGNSDEVLLLRRKMEERRLQQKLEKKSKKHKMEESVTAETKKAKVETPKTVVPSTSSANGTSLNGSQASTSILATTKLLSKGSIAKDPNKSEAFKSLFTSHKTCKEQPKAHWITYNPLYN